MTVSKHKIKLIWYSLGKAFNNFDHTEIRNIPFLLFLYFHWNSANVDGRFCNAFCMIIVPTQRFLDDWKYLLATGYFVKMQRKKNHNSQTSFIFQE